MRIDLPRETERLGAVTIHGVQKVFELDGGLLNQPDEMSENTAIQCISATSLHGIEQEMAIIVPVKNERIRLIEGVLSGIPHDCLVIVISNSMREPIDRFHMERKALEQFNSYAKKNLIIVHQKDPTLAEAFVLAGYPDLLGEDGLIKNGKAEGMILATILAKICGRKYIGFVDSDNYFPGAVQEYVKEYAAGFLLSKSKYTMVRIVWHSKPKIVGTTLFFAKRGRVSVRTNHILNNLISNYTGFGTEIIKTGNAGEHAISMDLAMLINYSSGYSIEPYHFINMWEKFGGITPTSPHPEVMLEQVEIYQIESRNPHLHEDKGEEHVEEMSYAAHQIVYHSPICPDEFKNELLQDMVNYQFVQLGEEPAKPTYYPPLIEINLSQFITCLENTHYAHLLDRSVIASTPLTENDLSLPDSPNQS